ncbi:MAG: glycosyltransferase [Synergistales bacterium]|nr:glycosyltransferase [Synergistales bacterium]
MPEPGLVSVVIPVYNEEECLPHLFPRLRSSMEEMNRPYEIIFVNDGSRDRSLQLLYEFHKANRLCLQVPSCILHILELNPVL